MKSGLCTALLLVNAILYSLAQSPKTNFTQLSIAPNGKWIAYISNEDGDDDLYVAKMDGSKARKIVATPNAEARPRWSPDSKWITFNAFPKTSEEPHDVFIVRSNGKKLKNLTKGQYSDGQSGCFSPNGDWVLFSSGKFPAINIFKIKPDGTGAKQLTQEQGKICYGSEWSPNGEKIMFSVFSRTERGIFTADANGSNVKMLVEGAESGKWSPDGRRIAFHQKVNDIYHLYTINADGTDLRQVRPASQHEEVPTWSLDGKSLYFQKNTDAGFRIYKLNLETNEEQQVIPTSEKR